jgi:hypothetical protein
MLSVRDGQNENSIQDGLMFRLFFFTLTIFNSLFFFKLERVGDWLGKNKTDHKPLII